MFGWILALGLIEYICCWLYGGFARFITGSLFHSLLDILVAQFVTDLMLVCLTSFSFPLANQALIFSPFSLGFAIASSMVLGIPGHSRASWQAVFDASSLGHLRMVPRKDGPFSGSLLPAVAAVCNPGMAPS